MGCDLSLFWHQSENLNLGAFVHLNFLCGEVTEKSRNPAIYQKLGQVSAFGNWNYTSLHYTPGWVHHILILRRYHNCLFRHNALFAGCLMSDISMTHLSNISRKLWISHSKIQSSGRYSPRCSPISTFLILLLFRYWIWPEDDIGLVDIAIVIPKCGAVQL